jgi:D-alanine--poly(phosphoribitol) ligase subunit 2
LGVGSSQEFSSEDRLLQLGLDSLKMMSLIAYIEKNFSIEIPNAEISPDQMKSLASIEDLINRHQSIK